jgi:hypothetical protein
LTAAERAELTRLRREVKKLKMEARDLENLDVRGWLWSREKGASGCGWARGWVETVPG